MKTKQWFIEMIGKTVYRDVIPSDSMFAKKNGYAAVFIKDTLHAEYIYDIQQDFEVDGYSLNYRDEM